MAAITAERDLLFGLLALQIGLIDQGQLVAAFQAWTRDTARALADHLVGRGDLEADDRSAVEALVARHLKKHGGDVEQSLAAIPAGRSTRESLAQIGDPDLSGTLGHLGAAASQHDGDPECTATYSVGTATSDGQRFRVLRPHAQGGLGAVFVALDEELHREVALKQILDRHADDPASRQRFLIEAEITGGLEHPGIVPVYGLGSYADGRPYYAMRFIKGDSLKEAIEHFHANESLQKDPGRRSLELRKLLRRFLDVCNAIGYAHARGVLHRDIKPGNIIVGKHGETLVVDWGLAKPLGHVEPGSDIGERTLRLSSASGSAETLPGSALGTPAYMSPEQARGDLEHLGPRSDVYSLGATLYCLLTGRVPLEGDDIGELLRKVQSGEFPPPRQVDPSVDAALQAVCLKAMATRPEDRYPSCRALADDVERWMADEPVSSWREPLARRARRWMRRHRTAVTAAAVLLVSATGALGASNVLVRRQRERAEANFRLARGAVDDMYTEVAQQWLAQEGALVPLQRKFLEKALAFYERFARPEGSAPELRLEAAKASRRVGEIQRKLGRTPAADAAFRRQLDLLESLAAAYPARPAYRADLAMALYDWAWYLWETGRPPDGPLDQSLALLRGLERAAVPGFDARPHLRVVYATQGQILSARGRLREAEAAHRRALALHEEVNRGSGKAPDEGTARGHVNLGAVLRNLGRHREAEAEFDRAVASAEEALARDPKGAALRSDLARDLSVRGSLRSALGRNGEAEADHRRAADLAERLAADFPAFPHYQDQHAALRRNLAGLLAGRGRWDEARREYDRVIVASEALVRAHPDVPEYRANLVIHHGQAGHALTDGGRTEEADRAYAAARTIAEALAAEHPAELVYRRLAVGQRANRAHRLRASRRLAEADAAYDAVIAGYDALIRDFPDAPESRSALASALASQGEARRLAGRPERAAESLERAVALYDALAREFPDVPGHRTGCIQPLLALARVAFDRKETARARELLERADPYLRIVQAADPEGEMARHYQLLSAHTLAQIQAREGDVRAAEATTRRFEALHRSPRDSFNVAASLQDVMTEVTGSTAPESDRAAVARVLGERAVVSLRAALARGYRNMPQLRAIMRDEPFGSRPDLQVLVLDSDFPADPFAR